MSQVFLLMESPVSRKLKEHHKIMIEKLKAELFRTSSPESMGLTHVLTETYLLWQGVAMLGGLRFAFDSGPNRGLFLTASHIGSNQFVIAVAGKGPDSTKFRTQVSFDRLHAEFRNVVKTFT
jgi:hypothetical protein